jgi:uncharacterized protein
LLPSSLPGLAVAHAFRTAQVLASDATMAELSDVLTRPKFDRYLTLDQRRDFLRQIQEIVVWISIRSRIRACRDARNDKFLEVAVHGEADAILTGDADLLALNPFRGIAILTPAHWLHQQSSPGDL